MKYIMKTTALAAGLSVMVAGGAMAADGVTDTEIVLGSHTPLSGPAAIWGVASMGAAQIRFDEANEAGGIHGRQIRLIVEDNQYQVPLAVRATNKLIQRDEVFAIFGALGTSHNLAVKDRMFSENVPLLFPFTAAKAIQVPFEPLKVTWGSSYYDQTYRAVKHFIGDRGREKVCVMYQDTDYGAEVRQAVEDATAELGIEISGAVSHKPTATEFVGAMTGFQSAGCDLIIMGTIIRDTIVGYATARQLGIEADIVSTTAAVDNIVSGADGGATEGLYAYTMSEVVYRDTASEEALPFFDAYSAQFDRDPGVPAQLGYIWADLVVTALENAGPDLTVEAMMDGFHQIQDYQDPFGNPSFSFAPDDHHGADSIVLVQVQDGRWSIVEE